MLEDKHIEQIKSYLQVKPGESVALIGDHTSAELVDRLHSLIDDTNDTVRLDLDSYKRPVADVPEDLAQAVKGRDLCFYALDKRSDAEVDEVHFRRALNDIVEDQGGRVGNILAPRYDVIESAFSADAQELVALTQRIYDYMKGVSAVHVTSPSGTDMVFEFRKYNWVASTGFIKQGKTRNITPCEVYTHPWDGNGVIAIDGTYAPMLSNPQFRNTDTVSRMKETPLFFDVRGKRIKDIHCDDREIESFVADIIDRYENAEIIGEYGQGTNIGMKKLMGHLGHDEKFPTVHVAPGRGYPKETGAEYDCKIHHDGLILDAKVKEMDTGKTILDKGQYFV